ncbi:hypothetical protein [Methanimicrococcus blatticola]|uniref:Uncharacterized protein n=1 Tax=Methanimicrococcus blatticola TaxID=91560 RepID=A0A484F7Q8_9EURY|nr:hypothetical protein [Methanimicrococcus blatticola]MBZ3935087.1 hypothetical protein [Methanimicrococcus blatticola]MCC2508816.1 hypothetical protein [Methanimicrococcus blatticola]TDQ71155.1 hypothetical protein C7391_0258 [Methanimicrococcus blatticola]
MENKEIVTYVSAIVAVIGAIVLILGALAYFGIWALSYVVGYEVTAMIGGLILLIIGAVGVWYAKEKM